jgi:hypothetical protein
MSATGFTPDPLPLTSYNPFPQQRNPLEGVTAADVDPETAAYLNLPTLESTTAELLSTCACWVKSYVV